MDFKSFIQIIYVYDGVLFYVNIGTFVRVADTMYARETKDLRSDLHIRVSELVGTQHPILTMIAADYRNTRG